MADDTGPIGETGQIWPIGPICPIEGKGETEKLTGGRYHHESCWQGKRHREWRSVWLRRSLRDAARARRMKA